MLTDRRKRHFQWLGKLSDAHLTLAEPCYNAASRRIGERGKGSIKIGTILKHILQYGYFPTAVNSTSCRSRMTKQVLRQ